LFNPSLITKNYLNLATYYYHDNRFLFNLSYTEKIFRRELGKLQKEQNKRHKALKKCLKK